MKVCIVQPPYSTDYSLSDAYFQWELDAFDRCDSSMDLIVFPESAAKRCNIFWSDDPAETEEFLRMGIDTILTNDYHRIAQVLSKT